MKISERWLREWVNPPASSDELQQLLTMAGLEIESSEAVAIAFSGIVVGSVLNVIPHPDADKLRVCKVSDGHNEFQVVCGAANARAGIKVPFAKVGAKLGDELVIKKAKLRGVESYGMLCSAAELGIVESPDGLLELSASAPVGADIRDYLGLDDVSIEVNLTPNRGDCLGIAGLAREVGVLTRTAVTAPDFKLVQAVIGETRSVTIESPDGCPRYLGRVIRNINPEVETPLWMCEKLRRSGLRSIDPVVDVTNYVLLELGQPMHAFDLAKLEGGIKIRQAQKREKLVLLDGKEIELDPEVLVIADEKKVIAMAGIMGGSHSAVGPRTTDVFLESAFFSPTAIAGRARRFGLHTDAGHRYERGVDYNLPARAMERATELLLQITGGQAGPVTVCEANLPLTVSVQLRRQRIARVLGVEINDAEIEAILGRLGLQLASSNSAGWLFQIPSWRFDIAIEADLIEELARVRGYDNLPVTAPAVQLPLRSKPESAVAMRQLKQRLVSLGYQEVITYSFVDAELEAVLGEQVQPLALANPISQDMAVMRTNLWSGLLRALKYNQNRQITRLKMFETGLSFINKNNKINQNIKVSSIVWGAKATEQWGNASQDFDFYDLKGDIQSLLGLTLAPLEFEFSADTHHALQPGQTARISRAVQHVGWIGALHPALHQALDIPGKVFLAELDYAALQPARIPVVEDLSRFPCVRRDLALVVNNEVNAAAILGELRRAAGPDLQELTLFDVYQGQNIESGKKSLALGLTFQHASRTLVDADINPIIDSCIKALEAKFNAELR
jgi:phenylalanyl-tRNA synthetase beta chain